MIDFEALEMIIPSRGGHKRSNTTMVRVVKRKTRDKEGRTAYCITLNERARAKMGDPEYVEIGAIGPKLYIIPWETRGGKNVWKVSRTEKTTVGTIQMSAGAIGAGCIDRFIGDYSNITKDNDPQGKVAYYIDLRSKEDTQ